MRVVWHAMAQARGAYHRSVAGGAVDNRFHAGEPAEHCVAVPRILFSSAPHLPLHGHCLHSRQSARHSHRLAHDYPPAPEIGRASSRERVLNTDVSDTTIIVEVAIQLYQTNSMVL